MKGNRLALAPALLAATLVTLAGCQMKSAPPGIALKSRTRFEYEFTRYQDLAGFKSMAIAGDPETTHVSGIAFAYPFQGMAVSAAISFCEARREDRGIETPCRTYAIGDTLIPLPSDGTSPETDPDEQPQD